MTKLSVTWIAPLALSGRHIQNLPHPSVSIANCPMRHPNWFFPVKCCLENGHIQLNSGVKFFTMQHRVLFR